MRNVRYLVLVSGTVGLLFSSLVLQADPGSAGEPRAEARAVPVALPAVSGEEIFKREWIPNDPRSHGGDGLGPMFNESSCIGCHNQGGAGGAGPASKDVMTVSAITHSAATRANINFLQRLFFSPSRKEIARQDQPGKAAIERFFPGLSTSRNVMLHRSSVDGRYDDWKANTDVPEANVESDPLVAAKEGPAVEPRAASWSAELFVHMAAVFSFPHPSMAMMSAFEEAAPRSIDELWEHLDELLSFEEQTFQSSSMVASTRIRALTFIENKQSQIEARRAAFNDIPTRLRDALSNQRSNGGDDETDDAFFVSTSTRNTPALFGSGLIDSISDKVLEAAAATKHPGFDEVRGRVSRLADGRIGRFGWKGQTASLRDFTLAACAVELGLNVPGRSQSVPPYDPQYKATGLDLDAGECDALIQYLRDLPAPKALAPSSAAHAQYLEQGQRLFTSIGCATCHTPKLGDVAGIYSDLLLHNMGESLSDDGSGYGGAPPAETEIIVVKATAENELVHKRKVRAASAAEWRTPPLWGVRDSAPYLHDGQADTLEAAIALHGGQAEKSAIKFVELTAAERNQLLAFLKSLTAP